MGVIATWGGTQTGIDAGDIAAAIGGDVAVSGDLRTPVTDVCFDHRMVREGALFACVPGEHSDGHDFAAAAVAAGARTLLTERDLGLAVAQIRVGSVRAAMGAVADRFFGHPSRDMQVVGITGTNGKTTSAFLIEAALRSLGVPAGLIGTVETRLPGGEVRGAGRTTPEAFDLQRLLREMAGLGARAAAMEVSSEGLDSLRVEGTRFGCAVFTNLSQDHLNHHGTMERYFEAKGMLFRPEMSERAVVSTDDVWGRRLVAEVTQPLVTFGEGADVRAEAVTLSAAGSRFTAVTPTGPVEVVLRLRGRFNVDNALGVLAVAISLGWDLHRVAAGMAGLASVPGRMEPVDEGQPFVVLVDYAHTPDALEGVLRAAREMAGDAGRVIAVFGCGGDRDRGKRPLMGRSGASLADVAIITSDNPRSEDPAAIVSEVAAGAAGLPHREVVDRTEAISLAVGEAHPGDVVVIAGKGHETGQTFADRTVPFDDRTVARDALRERAR